MPLRLRHHRLTHHDMPYYQKHYNIAVAAVQLLLPWLPCICICLRAWLPDSCGLRW